MTKQKKLPKQLQQLQDQLIQNSPGPLYSAGIVNGIKATWQLLQPPKTKATQEVVINEDYGGFGLSRKAFLRLRELKHKEALEEPDIGENWSDGSGPRKNWGGKGSFLNYIDRTDPLLIKVIKELGKEANGQHASLKIVKIPKHVQYEISEYDGNETLHEQHKKWY